MDIKKKSTKIRNEGLSQDKMAGRRVSLTKTKAMEAMTVELAPLYDINSKISREGKANTTIQLTKNVDDIYQIILDYQQMVNKNNQALVLKIAGVGETVEVKCKATDSQLEDNSHTLSEQADLIEHLQSQITQHDIKINSLVDMLEKQIGRAHV